MNQVDIHADDYAISLYASQNILDCVSQGKLNSFSVIPNLSCFAACMDLLEAQWGEWKEKPLISVHLNFMEGKSCCNKEELPDLVDEEGFFKISWGSLLKASYIGKKSAFWKEQLKKEIEAQIDRMESRLPLGCELRIDSHQHTHMIPIVFEALLDAVDERKYKVRFIRVAQEPLFPFIKKVKLYPTYSPVNLIKNIVLNFYAVGMNRELKRRGLKSTLLWGIVMSGCMDRDRIKTLYPDMMEYSHNKKKEIEILFHPGSVLPEEITEEYNKKGFVDFHLSKGRKIEREAVKGI